MIYIDHLITTSESFNNQYVLIHASSFAKQTNKMKMWRMLVIFNVFAGFQSSIFSFSWDLIFSQSKTIIDKLYFTFYLQVLSHILTTKKKTSGESATLINN